jgi:uncharacterized membrane protein YcjF (UPF0283 family)
MGLTPRNDEASDYNETASQTEASTIDILNLPPRKVVHTNKRKKKEKQEREKVEQNVQQFEKVDDDEETRINRRYKKTEKKHRKLNVIVLRSILVLFILTLIAIPLYYKWGLFNDDFHQKPLNDIIPAGEEIHIN